MYCVRQITSDTWWVGGEDRRLALFENVFPIPRGVSYNSYLILDEKTVLMDTVDSAVSEQLMENLDHLLGERGLDYVVVTHTEPDHCATLGRLLERYPGVTVVCNPRSQTMIRQFFRRDLSGQTLLVKEGERLETGRHALTFYLAPMVHWPEVMVAWDETDRALYTADAFGTFGALGGNLFADEVDFPRDWMDDARRYYANIVGKYGAQVQALLNKTAGLDIALLCPLHGPVWRRDLPVILEKYRQWSTYTPECAGVAVLCGSVYGNTEHAAWQLACRLSQGGARDVRMYDVSRLHPSYLVAEAFRCSHLVLAASTYNGGLFTPMEDLLRDLTAHNLQNRTVALIQNGSWAPASGGVMRELVSKWKNTAVLEPVVTLRSALAQEQLPELDALAQAILDSLPCG